jgi:regulator of protease activity HflC (stomatin/prohibitin superfamily)
VGDVLVTAIGLLVLLVLLAVYASVTVVKQGEAIVIFRLGKSSADMVRGPGLQYIIPIVDRAVHVRLAETATDATVFGTSKDDVAVTADLTIVWRVVDPLKSVIMLANPEEALKTAADRALQDIDATEAIAYAGRAAKAIEAQLKDLGKRWGITIAEVSVRRVSRA